MQLEGLKILLAEDNATNRLVALQMLESLGAAVAVAGDGAEALDRVRGESFDLLLIDIEMPKLSGFEVIRRLAAEMRGPDRPVMVALTAYATPRQRDEIVAAGAAGIITKPIVSIERFGSDILGFVRVTSAPERQDRGQAEIDMEVYRDLTAAVGTQALDEFLGKVDADLAAAYDRMCRALSGADMAELRAATHILASVAGAVGAFGLQSLSQRLNRAAHGQGEAAIDSLGTAVEGESARLRAFLARERQG